MSGPQQEHHMIQPSSVSPPMGAYLCMYVNSKNRKEDRLGIYSFPAEQLSLSSQYEMYLPTNINCTTFHSFGDNRNYIIHWLEQQLIQIKRN